MITISSSLFSSLSSSSSSSTSRYLDGGITRYLHTVRTQWRSETAEERHSTVSRVVERNVIVISLISIEIDDFRYQQPSVHLIDTPIHTSITSIYPSIYPSHLFIHSSNYLPLLITVSSQYHHSIPTDGTCNLRDKDRDSSRVLIGCCSDKHGIWTYLHWVSSLV